MLRTCDPLSCTFYFFSVIELYCLVFSGCAAARVVISGLKPLSYEYLFMCLYSAGTHCKDRSLVLPHS